MNAIQRIRKNRVPVLVVPPVSNYGSEIVSRNSLISYNYDIKAFNDYLEQNNLDLNKQSVLSYFYHLEERCKLSTITRKKYAIKRGLQLLADGDIKKLVYLDKLFANIRTGKRVVSICSEDILSEEELVRLFSKTKPRVSCIMQFLYFTGVRISEMLGIKHSDICLNGNLYKISINGKGRKQRNVSISIRLYEVIGGIFSGKKYLFESATGNKLDRANILKEIKKAGERLLNKSINCHIFRHSRASHLILDSNPNHSLKAVSLMLGHSSVNITSEFYLASSIDMKELTIEDEEKYSQHIA